MHKYYPFRYSSLRTLYIPASEYRPLIEKLCDNNLFSTVLCYQVEFAVRSRKDKGKDTVFPVIKTCFIVSLS